MLTKRLCKVADSQQINLAFGRPQLIKLLKLKRLFVKSMNASKRTLKGQFHRINEILYEWFKKCCKANIYPDGQMLKEDAVDIKKHFKNVEFLTFTASNG